MPHITKLLKQTLNLEWKNQRRSSNGLGVHFHQPVRLLDASQNSAQGIRAAHRKCRGQGPDAIYGQTPSGLAETWGEKRMMSSIEPLREFHWRVGWLGLCGGSGVFESHRDSRELLFEPRVSTFGDRPWVLSLIAIKPAGVTPSCRWLPTRNLLWALLSTNVWLRYPTSKRTHGRPCPSNADLPTVATSGALSIQLRLGDSG